MVESADLRRLLGLEIHGDAIDAIAQVRRRRPVLEHVAEMAAAAAAVHFRARHAVAAIGRGFDRARHRIVETRPAGVARYPIKGIGADPTSVSRAQRSTKLVARMSVAKCGATRLRDFRWIGGSS